MDDSERCFVAIDRDVLLGLMQEALESLPADSPARRAILECQVLTWRGDYLAGHVPLTDDEAWQRVLDSKAALEETVARLKGV